MMFEGGNKLNDSQRIRILEEKLDNLIQLLEKKNIAMENR